MQKHDAKMRPLRILRKMCAALAALLPLAAQGQCEPLPLPYETDLITGFHTPWEPNNYGGYTYTVWSTGFNHDNCWTGYIERPSSGNTGDAAGCFGFVARRQDGTPDTNYARIGVGDSLNDGLAMLIAPEFDGQPASIRLTMVLHKVQRFEHPVCTNYYAFVDVGWVRDIARPSETFTKTGTMCVWTYPERTLTWKNYCLPVHDSIPDGHRFAFRMRTELQPWPHPNGCGDIPSFLYSLMIKRFEASTQVCNPAVMTDTTYLTDSVCQHSPYSGHGITLTAQQTADTGQCTYTQHDYEYLPNGNCLHHVRLLTLKVLPSDISIVYDSILPGSAYPFGDRRLTLAGGYAEDHGLNAYGCPAKDSLELSIRRLPPMDCGAEIEVERLDWYISQPTEVRLRAANEATTYRWSPANQLSDSAGRETRITLQPDSEQRVWLRTERIDTVNHIHRGAETDTLTQLLQLTVPVEPQTRYRLEAGIAGGSPAALRVYMGNNLLVDRTLERLEVELFTYQYRQIDLTLLAGEPVRLTALGLRRHCRAEDSVTLRAHSVHPAIAAERSTICLGDSLVLEARQTDTYRWSAHPADTALDAQQGRSTITVSPRVRTTYHLLAPDGSVADSLTVEVERAPASHIVADREALDFDHPVLGLEEQSTEVASVHWRFSDGNSARGRHVRHLFADALGDSVWVAATSCSPHGCCTDTLLRYRIRALSAWFPNAFTPSAESNNRFGLVASEEVELCEMTIYNRQGLLVYHSTDPAARWDGTDRHGTALPQGAYAYTCRFRLRGGMVQRTLGTVLLLR